LRPTEGDAFVNGKSVLDPKERVAISKEIGLLTENPNLYERLTADQNLVFFAKAYGLSQTEIETRVSQVLSDFDLDSRRRERVVTFSKGMKQKLAIARVLLHRPSILLLDEPTASLDAESAKSIRKQISETAREGNHTVLLSTHNLDDASRLCDRIGIIGQGRILAVGSEEEILTNLRNSKKGGLALGRPLVQIGVLNCTELDFGFLIAELQSIDEVTRTPGGIDVAFDPALPTSEIDIMTSKAIDSLVNHGAKVIKVLQKKPTLEDLYLEIVSEPKDPS